MAGSKSHRTARRLGIAALLAIPVVFIATTMPMQAMGNPVSPASAGDAFLTVTQADNPDPAVEGDNVTYTVSVANDPEATGPATSVTLRDFISSDVDFVSASPEQGSCDAEPVDGLLECSLGTIAPDNSVAVDVVVTTTDRCSGGTNRVAAAALTEPCTIENHVIADSPDAFTAAEDFEDTTVNPAGAAPNLHISKTDSPDPVQELNPISYRIDVTNDGDADATNTVVTDHLPAGSVFNSVTTSQGSCSHTATTVTCHLGTLVHSSEGVETVTIVVQAPNVTEDTVIENSAGVSASNADSADTTADTTVLVNEGGSTTGEVPPNSTTPLTFTTGTQSANGQTAVTGGDKTAVSIVVPKGGPGGTVTLEEEPCAVAPCTGAAAAKDTAAERVAPSAGKVVLGGVVFNVVPPPATPTPRPSGSSCSGTRP